MKKILFYFLKIGILKAAGVARGGREGDGGSIHLYMEHCSH